jgi:cytidine deaminase
MAELGPEMLVYISDESGNYRTMSMAQLLPDMFIRRTFT